jgi:chromosome segregation ATPase
MGGVRLVDLKGTLIEAGGAMVGGSISASQLSFSKADRNKLDEVTKELQNAIQSIWQNWDSAFQVGFWGYAPSDGRREC